MILTKRESKKGFTLIELLVVIAIIAILAAILFPIFARVRTKARETSCLSNMKQIGVALVNYARDHSGRFPRPYAGASWDVNTWRTTIRDYAGGDMSLFTCPEATRKPPTGNLPPSPDIRGHYGMSYALTWNPDQDDQVYGFAPSYMDEIGIPSETFLVGENMDGDWEAEPWQGGVPGANGPTPPSPMPAGVNGAGRFCPYHSGGEGGCFIYCDGHAKFVKTAAVDGPRPGGTANFYYWLKGKTGQE